MKELKKTDMAGTEKAFTESSDANRELYMQHPAFSIGTFEPSLMKMGSVQKISNILYFYISVLIFLLCFGSTSGSTKILPVPTLNVTSHTYTACNFPPSSCPLSDDDKNLHIVCLFDYQGSSCPPGWTYFCDDKSSKYLVEGCFERHKCPKGTVNYIDFNPSSRTAVMKCKKCQEHFIQREEHDTAQEYITGCDTPGVSPHILQNLDKMVQVFNGGTTDYSEYVCDTSKGYSEKGHITLCNVSNYCRCQQGVICVIPQFPILLPNGKCDKRCAVDRDIYFNCKLYELNGSIDSTKAAQTLSSNSIHVTNPAHTLSTNSINVTNPAVSTLQDKSDDQPGDLNKTDLSVPVYVLTLISVISVLVIVVLVYKWMRKHRKHQEETPMEKNVRCQQNNIKGGKGENTFIFMNGNEMEMAYLLALKRKVSNADSGTDQTENCTGIEKENLLEQQSNVSNGDSGTDLTNV